MKNEITQLVQSANVPHDLTQKVIHEFTPHADTIYRLRCRIETLNKDIVASGGELSEYHAKEGMSILKLLSKVGAASEKTRKKIGKPYHDTWKACNTVGNFFKSGINDMKIEVEHIAHHVEIAEQQRRAALAEARIKLMSPYKSDAHTLDLELMEQDMFDMMLAGAKAMHEKAENEKAAERKRLQLEAEAAHKADALETVRKMKELEAGMQARAETITPQPDPVQHETPPRDHVPGGDTMYYDNHENTLHENTPHVHMMPVADVVELIKSVYVDGYNDGKVKSFLRVTLYINTLTHPEIVAYLQHESGTLGTPLDVIIPEKKD